MHYPSRDICVQDAFGMTFECPLKRRLEVARRILDKSPMPLITTVYFPLSNCGMRRPAKRVVIRFIRIPLVAGGEFDGKEQVLGRDVICKCILINLCYRMLFVHVCYPRAM